MDQLQATGSPKSPAASSVAPGSADRQIKTAGGKAERFQVAGEVRHPKRPRTVPQVLEEAEARPATR